MTAPDLIVDRWREIAAVPQNGFRGMTELNKGDRSWQLGGFGPEIRAVLEAHVESVLAAETAGQVRNEP
jgi:hypothetical protein